MTDSTEGASGADTTMTTTQQHDPALTPSMDVLGQLPVGVMLMDADGAVIHRNDALQAMWGDLVHRPAEAPFPSDAYGPDGVPMDADDWPIRRSLATGDELRDISIELDRPDDAPVSIVAESRPLVDPRGRRVGAVMVVRDVSREHDQAMLRQAFAGILSHELRTPVTSIYSGIELLRAHRLSEPVTRDVLNDVAVEAETLHRLIEDLLVMVRLERGVSMALPEPILVHRIVGLALADEARRWPDRTFVADIPADLPTAQGDEGLLRQVLRNLLSNAAKYGPRSGTVRITAAAVPDGLTVTVSDEGPGIDDDQRDRVFELFDRAGTSTRIQGSGIGLFVARALMEAMDGTIAIGRPARGAEFTLHLPRYPERVAVRSASADTSAAPAAARPLRPVGPGQGQARAKGRRGSDRRPTASLLPDPRRPGAYDGAHATTVDPRAPGARGDVPGDGRAGSLYPGLVGRTGCRCHGRRQRLHGHHLHPARRSVGPRRHLSHRSGCARPRPGARPRCAAGSAGHLRGRLQRDQPGARPGTRAAAGDRRQQLRLECGAAAGRDGSAVDARRRRLPFLADEGGALVDRLGLGLDRRRSAARRRAGSRCPGTS